MCTVCRVRRYDKEGCDSVHNVTIFSKEAVLLSALTWYSAFGMASVNHGCFTGTCLPSVDPVSSVAPLMNAALLGALVGV